MRDLGLAFGMDISAVPRLVEFTSQEYRAFPTVMGERLYHRDPAHLLRQDWDTMLGAKQGTLLKVGLFFHTDDKEEAERVLEDVLVYCMVRTADKQSSAPARPADARPGLFVWDVADGNVVVQSVEADNTFAINIFLTSRLVRTQAGSGCLSAVGLVLFFIVSEIIALHGAMQYSPHL